MQFQRVFPARRVKRTVRRRFVSVSTWGQGRVHHLNVPGALYPAESSLVRPQDTLKGCARRCAAAGRQA